MKKQLDTCNLNKPNLGCSRSAIAFVPHAIAAIWRHPSIQHRRPAVSARSLHGARTFVLKQPCGRLLPDGRSRPRKGRPVMTGAGVAQALTALLGMGVTVGTGTGTGNAMLLARFGSAMVFNLPLYAVGRVRGQGVLTAEGLDHAFGLGVLLWTVGGVSAYVVCFSFLVVGSLATRVGRTRKERLGIAEARGGKRGPENLWGAAGACAICAILAGLCGALRLHTLAQAMRVSFCGAVAAKSADTVSSEIGKAYGTNTFLITTLQPVPPGTEGAVSTEGTTAGIVAALATATLAHAIGLLPSPALIAIVTTAGTLANVIESVIGARFQNTLNLTNEQVNFVNTCIGAIIAGLLFVIFSPFLAS